jgi:hypothetical protein
MISRRYAIALAAVASYLGAQTGLPPRPTASDYPAHADSADASVGAEYMVHTFGAVGQTYVAADHLVVEVAVYPPKGKPVNVAAGDFTLHINGHKTGLVAQSPGFVASALKYADWETRRNVETSVGMGSAGVILGRPRAAARFPGDRRDPDSSRLPPAPRAPDTTPGAVERRQAPKAEEVVVDTALPDGLREGPVSGYIYFAYKGKTKSIKSLQLRYRGAVLQLK